MRIGSRLIILFLVISIVPVTVFGVATAINTEREITRNVLRGLDALATIQESRVQGVLDQNLERLVTFTSRLQLKISIDDYNRTGNPESQELANRILQSALPATESFKRIHVLDLGGTIVASTDSAVIGQSYAGEDFFARGIEQNDVYNIFMDDDGRPVFYLSGPMVFDGDLIGVAVIVSDASNLISAVQDTHAFGQTSETVLVRRYGDGAQFIVPLKFDPDAALARTLDMNSQLPSFRALAGVEDTFTDLVDYRGEPVVAATRYVDGPGWGLAVKVDKAEAYAPLDNVRNLSITVGAIVAAAAVATSFLLGRTIANPILKLGRAADQITKGNYDVDITVESKDEVGQLARDFSNMKEAVRSTNENLERLVERRTAELVEKEKALKDAVSKQESLNRELEVKNKSLEDAVAHVLEVERSKEEFVSMISHELKTPLVPIKGYSEMLLNPGVLGDLNDEQRKAVKAVLNGTEKLDTLVGDMLDVFKLDMNKMAFSMTDVEAKKLVEKTIFDMKSIAEENQVELRAEAGGLQVFCDPNRVEQVLANLIKNSVDFVPARDGRVVIRVEKARSMQNIVGNEKEMAVFSVEDNGPGIPADKVDNIFKKFYQIDASVTRKHGGTGLGLVICKGIVERHGGKIWVDTSYKNGACLKFTLPLSQPGAVISRGTS
jgi:signal transduction histidine kinase